MERLTRWQIPTIAAFGIVFLILTLVVPLWASTSEVAAAVNCAAEEARMLQLVNEARNNVGLPSLYMDQRLVDFARSYSSEMIQYNFFSHVSPVSGDLQQRISARGIGGWLLAGENIAKAPNVEVAFDALMNSPTHRDNILRPEFNCVGIGVVQGPDCLYISQEFMQFSSIPPTADIPSIPATPPTNPDSFDSYLLVMNPNDAAAEVEVVFQGEDGSNHNFHYSVAANSRFTVPVRETLGGGSFSAQIHSSIPVLAERAMYFSYQGRDGGHGSIGASQPSNTWFFAEGYTGEDFDTWVLLQNPNDSTAVITLNFMRPDGKVITQQVSVPARRRHSVHVDEVPGLENSDVSTQVTSNLPVIAERAMYFSYNGKRGGHATIGAASADMEWYLAEGYTGESFDEYVLLLNPGDTPANVDMVFMRPDGLKVHENLVVAPHSRFTIHVDEIARLEATEVSASVSSDAPIIVERAQYFSFRGKPDGTDSIGARQPSNTWFFAEGCVK